METCFRPEVPRRRLYNPIRKDRRSIPPLLLDEPLNVNPLPSPTVKGQWWQRRDRLLLAIETLLLLGLLISFIKITQNWMILRQASPTENVTIPVSIAPVATTTALPVEQSPEIPAHLQAWLNPASTKQNIIVPPMAAQPGTRIAIPSIGVDAPIGEGTDQESLKYKVGHHPGTANPGQRGNMVLAAHNDIYGEIFRYLPDLSVGEVVTVYAGEQAFRYQITERRIILPSQTEVMLPTTEPTITLISCYPYLIDTHRIILFGELIG